MAKNVKDITRTEIYKVLYDNKKASCMNDGLNEDKASRFANMFAVKNTERYWLINTTEASKSGHAFLIAGSP